MDAELNALIDEISELYGPQQQRIYNSSDEGEEVVRQLWPKLRDEVAVKDSALAWPRLRFRIPRQASESSSERACEFGHSADTESDCAAATFTWRANPTQTPRRRLQLEEACRVQDPQSIPPDEAQKAPTAALGQRSPSAAPRQARDASRTRPLIPDSRLASTARLSPSKRLSAPAAPENESVLNAATPAAPQTPSSPLFPSERGRDENVPYQGAIREFLAHGAGRVSATPCPIRSPGLRRYFKDLVNVTWPQNAQYPTAEPDVRGLPPAGTRAASARVRRPRPQDYPVVALAVPPLQLPLPLIKRGWVARKRIATVAELRRMRRAAKHAEPDDADDEDDSDEGW